MPNTRRYLKMAKGYVTAKNELTSVKGGGKKKQTG